MKERKGMIGLLALALVATAPPLVAHATTLAEVQDRGELVMLCWPHQESIFVRHMVEELGREGLNVVGGIDVDIMRLFAKRLGVDLEVKPVRPDFGALIPSLLAGEGDVIASSMTITRNRRAQVDFTQPYFTVRKVVVVRRGSNIHQIADLDGKVASAARGSSHEEQLLALGLPHLEIVPVQFMLENYEAVAEGRVDFTLVDSSSAARVLKESIDLGRELEVGFVFPESDGFGYAVTPGSDLRQELDQFLTELRATGELERIIRRYLPAEEGLPFK